MKIASHALYLFLGIVLLLARSNAAPATSFNYQGRLLDDGAPADGVYDLQFALFSDPAGGLPLTSPLVREDVSVSQGLFNVELDFGSGVFGGEKRWLAIGVRSGANTGGFFTLPMRQALASVPQSQFALVAGSVTDGAITAGMISNGAITTEKIQNGAVTSEKIASAQVVKSLNGLRDTVTLTAGANLTLNTDGNAIQLGVAPGSFVAPDQVMSILLENDGIGSGISADFIDGIDSANLARKTEVQDRVLRDGDTMRGALTLDPFPGSQALLVHGDKMGTANEAVAYIRNNRNAADAAPALRVENNAGKSADGALSVANNSPDSDGYVARFANAAKHVASLNTAGTLHLTPNSGQKALVISGDAVTDPILEVRKSGFGNLAVFGNPTEDKLKIDYVGGINSKGNIQADLSLMVGGNANIGGNATIAGNVSANNLPFVLYTHTPNQGDFGDSPYPVNADHVVSTLSIDVPATGVLVIHGHVALGGVLRAGIGSSWSRCNLRLERLVEGSAPEELSVSGLELAPDVFAGNNLRRIAVSAAIFVQPGRVNLRTVGYLDTSAAADDISLGPEEKNLTVMYFPSR